MLDLIFLKNLLFQKSSFLLLLYFFFFSLQFFLRHHGNSILDVRRAFRNGLLALFSVFPITMVLSSMQSKFLGSNTGHELPFWGQIIFAILFFDLVSFFWHWLNHRIPFFWRFHLWHHLEAHLETTAALRFHSGELIFSAILRLGILAILPLSLSIEAVLWSELIYQTSNFFQHSNLNIGSKAERWISKIFITPALHRVHHSPSREDRDQNFGTIFSFWDRIFRTYRWNLSVIESGEPEQAERGSHFYLWWSAWLLK